MTKKHLWMLLTAILLTLPRIVLTYPLYILAAVYLTAFTRRIIYLTLFMSSLALLSYLLNYIFGYTVSPTSFILELAMSIPLFIFIMGGAYSYNRVSPKSMFRLLNLFVCSLSFYNMTVNFGFPALLPYRDYLPDAYAALFGNGGAKIVTVIGFFGIAYEMFNSDHSKMSTKCWILLASVNFLVPSYLIGTVCGLVALLLPNMNNRRVQFILLVSGVLVLDFITGRVDTINTGLQEIFGAHPKILAIFSVLKLYYYDPATIVFGTGLGQFASTAAEWSSEYLVVSTDKEVSLPGLYMSYFHDRYIGIYLQEALSGSIFLISSSMNKPYSSISVIFAEFGLLLGSYVLYRIFLLLKGTGALTKERATMLAFVFSIFLLDVWHDNLWFIFMLILYTNNLNLKASASKYIQTAHPGAETKA